MLPAKICTDDVVHLNSSVCFVFFLFSITNVLVANDPASIRPNQSHRRAESVSKKFGRDNKVWLEKNKTSKRTQTQTKPQCRSKFLWPSLSRKLVWKLHTVIWFPVKFLFSFHASPFGTVISLGKHR